MIAGALDAGRDDRDVSELALGPRSERQRAGPGGTGPAPRAEPDRGPRARDPARRDQRRAAAGDDGRDARPGAGADRRLGRGARARNLRGSASASRPSAAGAEASASWEPSATASSTTWRRRWPRPELARMTPGEVEAADLERCSRRLVAAAQRAIAGRPPVTGAGRCFPHCALAEPWTRGETAAQLPPLHARARGQLAPVRARARHPAAVLPRLLPADADRPRARSGAGPLIVASNHRSFLDPFVIGASLPWRRPLHYVAKVELFEPRWQGWLPEPARRLPGAPRPVRRGDLGHVARGARAGRCHLHLPRGHPDPDRLAGAAQARLRPPGAGDRRGRAPGRRASAPTRCAGAG